jgi:hypothetical protein
MIRSGNNFTAPYTAENLARIDRMSLSKIDHLLRPFSPKLPGLLRKTLMPPHAGRRRKA